MLRGRILMLLPAVIALQCISKSFLWPIWLCITWFGSSTMCHPQTPQDSSHQTRLHSPHCQVLLMEGTHLTPARGMVLDEGYNERPFIFSNLSVGKGQNCWLCISLSGFDLSLTGALTPSYPILPRSSANSTSSMPGC